MSNTETKLVQQQISDAVKNYLPRCCGQCRNETALDRCQLNADIDTSNYGMTRRHPDCPIDKKGGRK